MPKPFILVHRLRMAAAGLAALAWLVQPPRLSGADEKANPTGQLPAQEESAGFVSLFDGKSLRGWQGATEQWTVSDGKLIYQALSRPKGAGSLPTLKLMSERQYADFILRFEFKLGPATNNGVAIRAPLEGDAAFVGMEIQMIDTDGWPAKLKPFQVHGSLYGVVPAKKGHLKPVGEWNREEIECRGRRLIVRLNGVEIMNANLDEVQPIDGAEHPGLRRTSGHVGFLGHTGRVELRNIRLREL